MPLRSLSALVLAGLLAMTLNVGATGAQTDVDAPSDAEDADVAETPETIVTGLNSILLDAMRNADSLGYQGRYDLLRPTLTDAFNFPVMAQIAAGPARWRDFTSEQRQRLTESFSRMSVATFANRFDGYSGETFEVIGAEPAPRDRILVRSRLLRTDGEPPVEINYLLQEFTAGWRILDVYLDGIYSELSRQRSEYASILRQGGVEALIQEIDAVAQRLANGT